MKEFWEYFMENIQKIIKDIKSKDKEKRKKQIPNLLTLIRGIFAPITIIPAVITGHIYIAFLLIAICSLTDSFDGWYARKFDAQSEFGALLDAICDKLFVLTLAFPLVFIYTKWILTILIFELIISMINTYSRLKRNNVKSSIIGKVKTFILDSSVALCYLDFLIKVPEIMLSITAILTNVFQIICIIDYYMRYKRFDILNQLEYEQKN